MALPGGVIEEGECCETMRGAEEKERVGILAWCEDIAIGGH
jgi:hypothetical protein